MGILKKALGVVGLGLCLTAGLALARFPASRAPLSVQHVEVSRIGRFLAHELTREISASDRLRASEDADDGWKIILLTSDSGNTTFYSAILVRKQFDEVFDQYVFATQGACPSDSLGPCARDIIQRVQEPIVQFQSDWKDHSEPGAGSVDVTSEPAGRT